MAKKPLPSKYGPKKTKEIPLIERDGAIAAIRHTFKAAAIEAKRIAADKYLDREDVAASALRDLGSLFMLCAEWPAEALEYGCEHIRKSSKMFEGRK